MIGEQKGNESEEQTHMPKAESFLATQTETFRQSVMGQ